MIRAFITLILATLFACPSLAQTAEENAACLRSAACRSDYDGSGGVTAADFGTFFTAFGDDAEPSIPMVLPEPEPEPPTPGAAPYDLGAVPFDYKWPEPPVLTRTIRVPEESNLGAASSVPGAHIIVGPGSYPRLSVTRADQWYEFDNGATINGLSINRRAGQARTRITGGNIVEPGSINMGGSLDLLFDNVNLDIKGSIAAASITHETERYAMVNSTCVSFDGYCFFSDHRINTQDVILAGNNFIGPLNGAEGTVRGMHTERFIVVGNRLSNGGKHLLRNHGRVRNTYWARNTLVPGNSSVMMVDTPGGSDNSYGSIIGVWIMGNEVYMPTPATGWPGFHADIQLSGRPPQTTSNVTMRDNVVYTNGNPLSWSVVTGGGSPATNVDFGNNRQEPWRSAIPTAVDLGVGADH